MLQGEACLSLLILVGLTFRRLQLLVLLVCLYNACHKLVAYDILLAHCLGEKTQTRYVI